ncbi:extensin-like [Belonocnema kinseyi]|uniref:extensin-like n=1 Tax=Belonocnema kinseyi TaxID=2817044 RepID=UPI00143D228F|nr:extensin-like [Belonocnema kinseyi]
MSSSFPLLRSNTASLPLLHPALHQFQSGGSIYQGNAGGSQIVEDRSFYSSPGITSYGYPSTWSSYLPPSTTGFSTPPWSTYPPPTFPGYLPPPWSSYPPPTFPGYLPPPWSTYPPPTYPGYLPPPWSSYPPPTSPGYSPPPWSSYTPPSTGGCSSPPPSETFHFYVPPPPISPPPPPPPPPPTPPPMALIAPPLKVQGQTVGRSGGPATSRHTLNTRVQSPRSQPS